MSKRELTPTEVEMGDVLRNGYMAPEVKFERLLAIVEALVNENLAPAMSRARAEALEEAAHAAGAATRAWMGGKGDVSADEYIQDAVRSLIPTPAPATIPVERVREVLAKAERVLTRQGYGAGIIRDIRKDLGVPLGATATHVHEDGCARVCSISPDDAPCSCVEIRTTYRALAAPRPLDATGELDGRCVHQLDSPAVCALCSDPDGQVSP